MVTGGLAPALPGLPGTVLSQALSVFEELIRMEHRILDLQKGDGASDEAGRLTRILAL